LGENSQRLKIMPNSFTIIVPAYNERQNIPLVVERLETLVVGRNWEVVFVDDDSQDGSLPVLMELARTKSHVRFIRRIGRRGLASACLEGMASSAADIFAVMDCDLQHDETILPKMLDAFDADPKLELTLGTRYAGEGAGVGNWSKARVFVSRFATNLGSLARKTELSDPMSGFFAIRREIFEETVRKMTGKGFKILLDIVLSAGRPLKTREFSYEFRTRQHGESKLDIVVGFEYLYLLADKIFGRFVPVSFVVYVLAGLSGLFLHIAALGMLFRLASVPFVRAQIIATLLAMVSNFLVNNSVTFRQQRLKGPILLPGLLAYMIICGLGSIVNIQAAEYLFENHIPWWFAGTMGALVGAVWNYAVSTQIVWTWLPGVLKKSRRN
jgi:dolichol-phosphate mannosyltransferase